MQRLGLRAALGVPLGLLLAAFPALALDLQGHRGARGLAPENTLPAFAAALSIGVTTLELDTGITKDGVVVVSHELRPHPSTARGPDGRWLAQPGPMISSLTYTELLQYDVGRLNPASTYGRPFTEQKPVDGTRIPRLAEVFALAAKAGNSTVRFNIETKVNPTMPQATLPPAEFTRALIAAIRAGGVTRRTSIQSFDWATLNVVQAEAPEIPTVYLTAQQSWLNNIDQGGTWTAGLRYEQYGSVPKMVKAAGGKTWSPYFGDVDAVKLAEARALGIAVVVWTVNAPADIARMMDLGVEGIISDRPDVVRLNKSGGWRCPRPRPFRHERPGQTRPSREDSRMPPVTRTLIIAKVAVFLLQANGFSLVESFALWPPARATWPVGVHTLAAGDVQLPARRLQPHPVQHVRPVHVRQRSGKAAGSRFFLTYYIASVIAAGITHLVVTSLIGGRRSRWSALRAESTGCCSLSGCTSRTARSCC